MSSSDEAELARLDAVVAENDALNTPLARWRAADALFDRAELTERLESSATALPLYAEVAQRVDGCREPGPRALLICARNAVAQIQDDLGFFEESRAGAEALIEEHFADPPAGAIHAVVDAALLLGKLRDQVGETEQAIEILDQVIACYGRPGVPDHVATAAIANQNAGWFLERAGEVDASIQRYARVIQALTGRDDLESRRRVARAMAGQADQLYEARRLKDARALYRELLDAFKSETDPEIADLVAWAHKLQEHDERYLGRWARLRRRLWRQRLSPQAFDQDAVTAWQDARRRPTEGTRRAVSSRPPDG